MEDADPATAGPAMTGPTAAETKRPGVVLSAGVGLVIVALAAFAVVQGLSWRHSTQQEQHGEAAVAAAKKEVAALTTVSATHAQRDIDRVLQGATADFRSQFKKQAEAFAKALKSGKVTSTGTVTSAGIVSLDEDQAVVILSATGAVKNTKTVKAQARDYRLRAEMRRVEGAWLVSGLEFVA